MTVAMAKNKGGDDSTHSKVTVKKTKAVINHRTPKEDTSSV
jgi:hypothetical protein